MILEILVAIIGSGAISAFVTWILNRELNKARVEYTHAETVSKLTTSYGNLLENVRCLQEKLKTLERKNSDLDARVRVMKDKYESSIAHNEMLVQRVKVLAKILSRLLSMWEEEVSLDFLTCNITITEEDREFLRRIVEEANNVCEHVAD